jgi:D-serine deaminase-like pyridoxal phosphate-dependent protein
MDQKRIAFSKLNHTLKDYTLPAVLIDMDALDRNIERIRIEVERSGKKMRLASKSVRVPALLKYILEKGGPAFQGLLCYTIDEALFLIDQGFQDCVVAYPASGPEVLRAIDGLKKHPNALTLMVDRIEHIHEIESKAQQSGFKGEVPVAIDLDVSTRIFGLHLGVQRSSIRDLGSLKKIIELISKTPSLRLEGLMAYEAQIAGLTDRNPQKKWTNGLLDVFKRISIRQVRKRRKEVAEFMDKRKISVRFFNGGGTGSLLSTIHEPWLTEVTVGSGFLQSQLFDFYQGNRNEGAIFMGLRVTRNPEPGVFTFYGGGVIASGEIGPDRQPTPCWPEDMRIFKSEGFGEVQTPVRSKLLKIGDVGFFRPAKAGEVAERFNEYYLIRGDLLIDRVPTYRGLGKNFG